MSVTAGTVLIVDDKKDVRESVGEIIAAGGFRPLFASGGADAVRRQRRTPADVILMDMRMRGMDGIAAARAIRAFDPGVAIVAVTAYRADYHDEAQLVGITQWIDKPVLSSHRRRALLGMVRRGLANSRSRVLGREVQTLASELSPSVAVDLVAAVRGLRERLDRPAGRGTYRHPQKAKSSDIETLALVLGVALVIKDTPIAADLFSRVMFAELGDSARVRQALQRAKVLSIAADYGRDLRVLQKLIGATAKR